MDLFGELPIWAKFLLAFVIVFILIVATFWLLRRVGGARLGSGSAKGRQPRLAVIDAAAVDGRRRLVLIRRDNVEHLVMIGGPSDVVIEQNIVRAVPVASARDLPAGAARPPGAPEPRVEPAPRPAEASWPQPEPARPPRPAPAFEDAEGWPGETPARPYRPGPTADDQRGAPEPARAARSNDTMQRIVAGAETPPRGGPPSRERREPALRAERREPPRQPPTTEAPPVAPPVTPPVAPPTAEKAPEPTVEPRAPALAPDVNLADMAQRLEAALRRPIKPGERIGAEPAKAAPAAEKPEAPAAPEAPEASAEPEHAPPAPRPGAPENNKPASSKSVLDSLEQEMASLLGRPTGKE